PNGDADLADSTAVAGVTVRVYRDLASDAPALETPDAADPLLATLTTDATGRWTFANATTGNFWLTVDSRTIDPGPLNGGAIVTDTWAEQTYGPQGSLRALGAGGTELTAADGPVVGGRTGTGSDTATALVTAEHVFRAEAVAPRLDLDTAFSFNVVTNLEGGDATDLAPEGTRTVQGTMRQFVQNSNAIAGPNVMRFVPAVPTNASGGGHNWWQLIVSSGLPAITDAATTIDGDARQWNSPVNGVDPTATSILPDAATGASALPTGTVDIPELLLWGDRTTEPTMDGFNVRAPNATIEDIALLGFLDGIEVGVDGADTTSSATVTSAALGFDLGTQGDPGTNNRLTRGVRFVGGQQLTVLQNTIGFIKENGVLVEADRPFTIERNQIVQAGIESAPADGITILGGGAGTITRNNVVGTPGAGIDLAQTTNSITVTDNTVDGFGTGGADEFGIRVYGIGSAVADNLLANGVGSGVAVVGVGAVPGPGQPASQVSISGNVYGTIAGGVNGAAAIDLIGPSAPELPDGPTANDGIDGCGVTAGYGNQGLDSPVISIDVIASTWHITGTGCPNSAVEVYLGDSGTGLPTSPAYVTSVQADGTIDETTPPLSAAVLAATHATASQTDTTGSTSEFGPVVAIAALPPVLTNPGPQSATEFVPFTLNPVGSDPDSSPVVWSATGMPTGMTIDSSTGALAWTPGETDGGTSHSITLELTGGGVTVTETFVLTVVEDDQPPVVAPIPPAAAVVGSTTTQPVSGSDPDIPAVALSWSLQGTVPAGMSIDPALGTISFTPTAAGTFTVQVVASQPNLLSGSQNWTVTVTDPVGPPPVLTPPADATIIEGTTVTLPFTATNTTSFTLLSAPLGASIDPLTGVVTWPSPIGSGGTTEIFTVQASGSGGTDSGSVTVTVDVANAPPAVDPVSDRTVLIDDRIVIPITASDPDTPLNYTVLVGPTGMTVSSAGVVTWDDAGPVGVQNVTIRVSDSGSPALSTDVSFTIRVTLPVVTSPPTTGGGTTSTSTSTSTTAPTTTTTTTPPGTTPTTSPPTTDPPTRPSLPVDEPSLDVAVPDLGPPTSGPGEPTLSITGGISGLLSVPGSFRIPPTTIGLAGAWIFVLGVPLVLWERKRAVSVVTGIDSDSTLPAFATRNSTYPFAYLRADASMLWSRYRFMGLGEGQRVKVESPVGPVWVERRHLWPLHHQISDRESPSGEPDS
ncbi:MAG: hypothetical protein HKN24_06670, partial [Acidimicrobiales bacterium]|nr:hypothetical protein [Acidimicrobiales bacterium]